MNKVFRESLAAEIDSIKAKYDCTEAEAWRILQHPGGDQPAYFRRIRKDLATQEGRFNKGERSAILSTLAVCAHHNYPIPASASGEIVASCDKYLWAECRGLGEAFQIERPKGAKLPAIKLRLKMAPAIFMAVEHAKEPGLSGDALFETVALEMHINSKTIKETYHMYKKHLLGKVFPK